MSRAYLKKDIFSVTYLRRLKNISCGTARNTKEMKRFLGAVHTQPAWHVSVRSQPDLHWERHLRDLLVTSQKKCIFCDVFKTSQIYLKKDVFFVTSLRRLKNILKEIPFVWRL